MVSNTFANTNKIMESSQCFFERKKQLIVFIQETFHPLEVAIGFYLNPLEPGSSWNMSKTRRVFCFSKRKDTVDGRNPAWDSAKTLMKYLPYQLVQDFFHQQYSQTLLSTVTLPGISGMNPLLKSSLEVGSLSHHLQGFIHPRWLAGFLPSTVSPPQTQAPDPLDRPIC